ncbi:MAG: hypothetical protein EOP48_06350 [Sphingobacteriales bacterium]|nr:MAG: hypothetical protein EOP48_06350 [Sphingobacteriales bacterium]
MDKRAVVYAFLISVLFQACLGDNAKKRQTVQEDEFYTEAGGWDWVRIPLIKPYQATTVISTNEKSIWNIDFKKGLGTYNVRKIGVEDSTIYILSGRLDDTENILTLLNNNNVPTAWYIIDTRSKVEKGFASEKEFDKYLISQGYKYPKWYDIDSLCEALGDGGEVPWIPPHL